ncbi:MAG: helix-turn-helix transcriptional regulator [Capsulimonas sp.]|uniref:helix-turn-helix transcriptional regulator n=1 Tax=Capsulimonas sp. TaxID=2494211 RepID=UPI003265B22E
MHDSILLLHTNVTESGRVRFVGEHSAHRGQHMPLHHHNLWEFIFQDAGYIRTQQGDDLHAMHPGMALTHPPFESHADFADSAYIVLYIQWMPVDARGLPRVCHDDADGSLSQTAHAMLREWRRREDGWEKMMDLLSERLEMLLRRTHVAQRLETWEQAAQAAEDVMQRRYRELLTIREIASEACVSPASLNRYFSRVHGQTPMEYLWSIRIRHALALLHHTTLTLETVAGQCGFHSASHLSRHIKASTGLSPGRVRG